MGPEEIGAMMLFDELSDGRFELRRQNKFIQTAVGYLLMKERMPIGAHGGGRNQLWTVGVILLEQRSHTVSKNAVILDPLIGCHGLHGLVDLRAIAIQRGLDQIQD